jgi:hypothetical protein
MILVLQKNKKHIDIAYLRNQTVTIPYIGTTNQWIEGLTFYNFNIHY